METFSIQIINKINDSNADILLVCLGFPKQEEWVYNNYDKLNNVKVCACLGGSLDIYSKTKKIFKIDQPLYAWFERKESFSHSVYSKKHFETFPVLLEVLKGQSEKADKSLKVFYENLMLRKADIYLPHFRNAEVTDELKLCRDECIRKSEEILNQLDTNLLYEIYLENKKETDNKLYQQEKRLVNKYENSLSWKFSIPVRLIGKLFR